MISGLLVRKAPRQPDVADADLCQKLLIAQALASNQFAGVDRCKINLLLSPYNKRRHTYKTDRHCRSVPGIHAQNPLEHITATCCQTTIPYRSASQMLASVGEDQQQHQG